MDKTEVTVRIFEDIEKVKAKLVSEGYEEFEEFDGEDEYFTTLRENEIENADYKTLLSSSLIIRSYHRKSNDDKKQMLLFKKKTLDKNGVVVSEEKVATGIDDKDVCKRALDLAGLNNWVSLCQKNTFFRKGEIEIIVGVTKGLEGSIMEVEEYPSIANLSPEEKIEKLKEVATSLVLTLAMIFLLKKFISFSSKNTLVII